MSLKKLHKKILKKMRFERIGRIDEALKSNEFDKSRVIYAITNPQKTEIVYIGDSEQGRNVRGRLRAHLNARDKEGFVEESSDLYIHFMTTERHVLLEFEELIGTKPKLNKRISQRHAKTGG